MDKFDNVIEAWLAVELAIPGRLVQDALANLSEEIGRTVDHSYLSKWRLGKQTPPPEALRYMAHVAAETILRPHCGVLEDEGLDAIALAFSPPLRGAGPGKRSS